VAVWWSSAGSGRRSLQLFAPAALILVVQLVLFPMPVGAMFSGLIIGLLGSLGAVGLALVWRANRVVNFAQGDLGVFPATLSVLLITVVGLPWLVGMVAGLAAAALVGLLADVLVVRRFFRAPRLQLTVATLGLSQILGFAALLLPRAWGQGPAIRTLPAPFELGFTVGDVNFDANDLIALVVAPLLIGALALFLRLTDTGTAVRAAADLPDRASLLGIPVRRLEAQVWTLAAVLSFVSVCLTAGVTSLPFGLGTGLAIVLRALAALVIGRMTHFVAITVTAVVLGLLETGVRWNTGDVALVSPILAVLIIASLLLQRRGATRADRDDASSFASATEVRPVPAALARLREVRWARATVALLLALLVLGGPLLMGTNGQLKAGVVVVFATIGTSVVVLTGWAGQVSLGQMVFVGVGGAIGAWSTVRMGWDPFVSMVIAGPVGAAVAVLVGLPALRLRGLYLAVTTLAVSLAASEWLFSNRAVDWIPEGSFERPALFGRIDLDSPLRLYYFAVVVLVLAFAALRGIRRSRTGRVLIALRDNEDGVVAYGVNPVRAKLSAFALSGFVASVAGVVLVIHQASFRAVTYSAEESLAVFVATVIGGLGSLVGAVIGAVFQRGAQWLLPSPWSFLATGVGVLVVLLLLPDGLGGLIWRARDAWLRTVARRHGIHAVSLDRSVGGSDDPFDDDAAASDGQDGHSGAGGAATARSDTAGSATARAATGRPGAADPGVEEVVT
jgi:branched-chain amino acid transport system permease protein